MQQRGIERDRVEQHRQRATIGPANDLLILMNRLTHPQHPQRRQLITR